MSLRSRDLSPALHLLRPVRVIHRAVHYQIGVMRGAVSVRLRAER